jgi:hypothetical protein
MANEQIDFDELGIDFDQFDVASQVERLKDELQNRGLWESFSESDRGQQLLETLGVILARNQFMLQRERVEAFPGPEGAQRRSSVIHGYRALGQEISRRVAATTTLEFSIGSVYNQDIVIPQYTEVQHPPTGTSVLTDEDVILSQGTTSISVGAFQATQSNITQVSQGNENLRINIPSDTVADDGVRVFVGDGSLDEDNEWQEVDSLLVATPDSDVYESFEAETQPDETVDIIFGDDAQGRIPPQGQTITILYFETQGREGRIFDSNSITDLQDTINDISGNDVTDQVSVTNNDNALTGGSERQSLDEFRVQAPKLAKTADRAITRGDINALARDYPGVELANAVGERNVDPPNPDFADRILIYLVLEAGADGNPVPLTDSFVYGDSPNASITNPDEDSFLGFFEDKKPLSIQFDVEEAGLVHFYVRSELFIDRGTDPSVPRSRFNANLRSNLLAENNIDLNIGDAIRESFVNNIADETRKVQYHHTKLIEYARREFSGGTDFALSLDDFSYAGINYSLKPPFKRLTIQMKLLDGTVIAEDDGDGNLVATSDAIDFDTGTVDYTGNGSPWEMDLTFTDIPNRVYQFEFQTEDPRADFDQRDGDIQVNENQFPIYIPGETDIAVSFA